MPESPATLQLGPEQELLLEGGPQVLRRRLEVLAEDRESSAAELVVAASEQVEAWVRARSGPWDADRARVELDEALADLDREQGWRGCCARWRAALEGVLGLSETTRVSARELLAEELGLWRGGIDTLQPALRGRESAASSAAGHAPGAARARSAAASYWGGDPLGPGRRLPSLAAGVTAVAGEFTRGETIAAHGWSAPVAEALEVLHERGLAPAVVVSEGGADLGGRRLARRLCERGIAVRLVYDLVLVEELAEADRLWVGCEAVGAGELIARAGTRVLLEQARRLEVPSAVVTTSAELAPAGALSLPLWPDRERWLLWEHAPEGVELSTQCFERLPDTLPERFLTELGWESAGALALRALQVGAPTAGSLRA